MSQHRKPERKNETLPLAGVVEDTRARAASSYDRASALLGLDHSFDMIGNVFGELPEHAPRIVPAPWGHFLNAFVHPCGDFLLDTKAQHLFIRFPTTGNSPMDPQDSAYVSGKRLRLFLILVVWFGLPLHGKGDTDYESSREVVGLPVSIDKEIQGETEGFASLGHSPPHEGIFKQKITVGKETNRVY